MRKIMRFAATALAVGLTFTVAPGVVKDVRLLQDIMEKQRGLRSVKLYTSSSRLFRR